VASPALKLIEVEALRTSGIPNAGSLPDWTPREREAPVFTREADGLYISTADGLRGAKGAMVAIGLEIAAGLAFYSIWQVWQAWQALR